LQSNPERLKILQQRNQVLQIPAEPVEPPADDDVERAPLRIPDEQVERRALVLRSADPLSTYSTAAVQPRASTYLLSPRS